MSRSSHRPLAVSFALLASCCTIGFLPQSAAAQTAGAISVTIPPSVRGEAMGGLYLTQSNDYSARWGNPGMLAFMDASVVGLMYSKLVPDLANDVFFLYGGWLTPIEGLGTVQVDLTYLSYGESRAIDDQERDLGTFTSYEVSPAVGFGFKFLPHLGVGIAGKYVRVDLAPDQVLTSSQRPGAGNGTSWAFDLGALYNNGPARVGAVVSNLGPDITFDQADQSDPMPRTLRVGGTYNVYGSEIGEVLVGAEYEQSLVLGKVTEENEQGQRSTKEIWRSPVYHLGGEFLYAGSFAVRAGWMKDSDGDVQDWTAGFGFSWANAALEYASVPQSTTLGRVNRFALWYKY